MLIYYLALLDTEEEKSKFRQIYEKHRQLIYHTSYSILKDSYASEDITHDVLMKLTRDIKKISEIDCPKTRRYLVIISRNLSLNHLQKYKREQYHDFFAEDEPYSFVDTATDVEETIERKSDVELLKEWILTLPEQSIHVLSLRYDQGLSPRQIADRLEISLHNVYKIIQRAKQNLTERMEKNHEQK